MGKVGFSPIIGLAVVMALALAAVFGSMSLANPAQAQTTPDDTLTIYTGLSHVYDAGPLFSGVQYEGTNDLDSVDAATVNTVSASAEGDDDKATFAIAYGGTFPDGAPYIRATLEFTLTADEVVGTEAVTKRLQVTVMESMPVTRNMTTATPAAPADIKDLETLYTEHEQKHSVNVWTTGTGTGKIVGYQVYGGTGGTTGIPVAVDGLTVIDALPGTTTGSLALIANVGTDGMVALKGEATIPDDNTVDLSAIPICQTALGTFGACSVMVGDAAAADATHADYGFEVTLVRSTEAMETDNVIPAQTLQITSDEPTPSTTIELIDSDTPMDGYFIDGTGRGMIDRWAITVSGNTFAIEGTVENNVLTLTGYEAGNGSVTVTARDGLAATGEDTDDDPSKTFRFRVLAAEEEVADVNTPALEKGFIDNRSVKLGEANLRLDVSPYFTDGEGNGEITNYTFMSSSPDKATVNSSSATGRLTVFAVAAGITTITVTAEDSNDAADPTQDFTLTVLPADEAPTPTVFVGRAPKAGDGKVAYSFESTSDEPGDSARYDIKFAVMGDIDTLNDELVIELEDFGFPSSVDTRSVGITVDEEEGRLQDRQFSPETVTVDGEKLYITLGDMLTRDDAREDFRISGGSNIDVVIRQNAGITVPTEAKDDDYGPVIELGEEPKIEGFENNDDYPGMQIDVLHYVKLDPDDGGLGEMVTAKGLGFKNGTTLTVFRDNQTHGIVGVLDAQDDVLCSDGEVEGNIGTCTFEVSHPTFTAGATNHVNAVDGVNATAGSDEIDTFELKASISTSPKGGSPGEMLLVQVVDFKGNMVNKVTIGGQTYCGGKNPLGQNVSCSGSIDSAGSGNFSIEIPNWARGGLQELKVWDNATDAKGNADPTSASTKVTLVGPQIRMTSQTVIANQRISLIGTGFSPGASIANVEDLPDRHMEPVISIGGDPIDQRRINDGDPVRVDNGGNWSASVDLPLSEATTASGKREIRVRDSLARRGTIEVTIPDRVVTVTPDSGRVGTIALISGTGFPSKNDEGSSFSVEIEYEAANGNTVTISALTDASGRFEQQMRIPTTAAIPSSNQIHVRFDLDREDGGQPVTVPITVTHEVPEGVIMPSETSGGPGSMITINGEGFKSFVPVALVKIGTLDVTPSPKPSTDGNGMMTFDILIPGLDVGIQTIEVQVGRTTASVGFTVTESGVNPGDIKPVAEGLEDLGDNLVSVWNFNNDTKVWSFYDPTLEEGNTLTHMITGETYLIRIKTDAEVILNRDTRSLTCVGDNCWNQIVW